MEISRMAKGISPSSTLAITAKAGELRAAGQDVISFSAGEPDFPTPEHIRQAGIDAIQDGFTRYTAAAGMPELRQAVADKLKKENGLNYSWKEIVVSNGGKHALINALMAIVNPGDEVIIPSPFWVSYPQMVRIAGAVPVILQTTKDENFMPTREGLEAAVSPKTKALILTSPSNPTGMVYSLEDLEMVKEFALSHKIFVIADEMYEKLIYNPEKKHISIASLSKEMQDYTIITNGLSKSYAMTGWRMGYTAAPLAISSCIASLQSHMTSNPCSITQKASLVALRGDQSVVEDMRQEFAKRCDYIYARAQEIDGLSCLKPEGAFYLFVDISAVLGKTYKGETVRGAADFARFILEDFCVALIPCEDFGRNDYIRLSYAISMEDIQKGMDRMAAFIGALQ